MINRQDGGMIKGGVSAHDYQRECERLREQVKTLLEERDRGWGGTVEQENEKLRDRVMALEKKNRRFPIQGGPSIPWKAIAPCEGQAKRNHSQSLERLAERGGLSAIEAFAVLESRPLRDVMNGKISNEEALAKLVQLNGDDTALDDGGEFLIVPQGSDPTIETLTAYFPDAHPFVLRTIQGLVARDGGWAANGNGIRLLGEALLTWNRNRDGS